MPKWFRACFAMGTSNGACCRSSEVPCEEQSGKAAAIDVVVHDSITEDVVSPSLRCRSDSDANFSTMPTTSPQLGYFSDPGMLVLHTSIEAVQHALPPSRILMMADDNGQRMRKQQQQQQAAQWIDEQSASAVTRPGTPSLPKAPGTPDSSHSSSSRTRKAARRNMGTYAPSGQLPSSYQGAFGNLTPSAESTLPTAAGPKSATAVSPPSGLHLKLRSGPQSFIVNDRLASGSSIAAGWMQPGSYDVQANRLQRMQLLVHTMQQFQRCNSRHALEQRLSQQYAAGFGTCVAARSARRRPQSATAADSSGGDGVSVGAAPSQDPHGISMAPCSNRNSGEARPAYLSTRLQQYPCEYSHGSTALFS